MGSERPDPLSRKAFHTGSDVGALGARSLGILRALEATIQSMDGVADVLRAVAKSARDASESIADNGISEHLSADDFRMLDQLEECKASLLAIRDKVQGACRPGAVFSKDDEFLVACEGVVEAARDAYEMFSDLHSVTMTELSRVGNKVGPFGSSDEFMAGLEAE